jgi:hypothetical protein
MHSDKSSLREINKLCSARVATLRAYISERLGINYAKGRKTLCNMQKGLSPLAT